MSSITPRRQSGANATGPLGVLSRLFFQALANCGQKPQDVNTFIRMYVAKKMHAKRAFNKEVGNEPPSEASIQQEVQTLLRSIHGERMTLKTLLQAVQVVGANELEISITLKFPTGVSVSSTEIVKTDQSLEE